MCRNGRERRTGAEHEEHLQLNRRTVCKSM
jgi:hypothetical protein